MKAIVTAMTAVAVATVMGALASRAHATSVLIGMPPVAAAPDKNSAAALKQLLQDSKSGVGAKLGTHLSILQKAYGAQPLWHDGGLRAKLPPLRMQDGYVRIRAYGDDRAALRSQLVAQGMLDAKLHDHAVTGRVPIAALSDIAASTTGLRFVKPVLAA